MTVKVTGQPGGGPVADAMVWVAGAENMGRTDAQGRARLAPLPAGEYTLVVTPSGPPYKESRYLITVPAVAPAAYNLEVSVIRPLTFDHGQEVPTPAFNPAPQRVSADKVKRGEGFRQVHVMRYASSAWMDGEGQEVGYWEPFFVFTGSDPNRPFIATYLLNGSKRWTVVYESPRAIGMLTITGVDESGMLVTFTSTSGVEGTFHLLTHQWQFE